MFWTAMMNNIAFYLWNDLLGCWISCNKETVFTIMKSLYLCHPLRKHYINC